MKKQLAFSALLTFVLFAIISPPPVLAVVGNDVKVSELFPVQARTQVVGTYGSYAIDRMNYGSCVSLLHSAKSSAGSACTLAVVMQESDAPVVGSKELRTATSVVEKKVRTDSTNLKIGCKFTQTGARQINSVSLYLKKTGTLTAGKAIIVTLQTNNSGVPSGTLVSADAIDSLLVDSLTTSYAFKKFTFQKPIDVANSSIYHVVVDGNYDLSAANYVSAGAKTVASGGDYNLADSAGWNATVATTQVLAFDEEFNFSNITGGSFTGVTELAPSIQTVSTNLAGAKRYVRAKATIVGTSASFQSGASIILGDPKTKPTY
jgi:hypothetical protein